MAKQKRPNRTNEVKAISKKKIDDLYTIRLVYNCTKHARPRTHIGTWPMHSAFITYHMPCPRLSMSKEYTFYFTSNSLNVWLPRIKMTLLERGDLDKCILYIYEPNRLTKQVYADKTQVVTQGMFKRKEHTLITSIVII